ncbi:MAG: hypothetical protein WC901_02455 [Candidatus Margulisiibacteriota bacterium]
MSVIVSGVETLCSKVRQGLQPPPRTPVYHTWGVGDYRARGLRSNLVSEDHFAETPGGFHIFLKRIYRPVHLAAEGQAVGKGEVIACPGSWENGNLWRIHFNGKLLYAGELDDLDAWANFFADQGLEFWAVNLFCSRIYDRYVARKIQSSTLRAVPREDVNVDDLIDIDVKAVLDYVYKVSGGLPIYWLGHSFGGMLGYGYLGLNQDPRVKALATLASPVRLGANGKKGKEARRNQRILRLLGKTDRVFSSAKVLERYFHPNHALNRHIVTVTNWVGHLPPIFARFSIFDPFLFNYANVDPAAISPFVLRIAEPIFPQVLDFFHGMIRTGGFTSYDERGRVSKDFGGNMRNIRQPLMVVLGGLDHVAAPSNVRLVRESYVGDDPGREKDITLVEVAEAGHLDLVVGKKAPPLMRQIADFFLAHP